MRETSAYLDEQHAPARASVDALAGLTLIEFGTGWCGHCQAAQPALVQWLSERPNLRHLRIEDGSGRALGRSFRVKLWPTLILFRDGQELARVVRPLSSAQIGAQFDPFVPA
jgi:thioredoxin 1